MNDLMTPSSKATMMQMLAKTKWNLEYFSIMIGPIPNLIESQSQGLTTRCIKLLTNNITILSIWIMIQTIQIIGSLKDCNLLKMNQMMYLTSRIQTWWVRKETLPQIILPLTSHLEDSKILYIRNQLNNSSWALEGNLGLNLRLWCRETPTKWSILQDIITQEKDLKIVTEVEMVA